MKKLCLLMMTLALLLTVVFSKAENTLPATASYSIISLRRIGAAWRIA